MIGEKRAAHARRQRGGTLIEAMVAVVVLSVGLLGVAAMQLSSLKTSTSANYRSIASLKASELAERMRANLIGVYYDRYVVGTAPDCSAPPAILCASTAGATAATSCTADQMAAFDLYEVSCVDGITDLLPNGDLSVVCNDDADPADADACTDGSSFAITVSWQANMDFDQGAATTEELVMTVLPGTGE